MRVNANRKIHKLKRDPYKQLLKTAGILAIVLVAGIGIFYLCTVLIVNDYQAKKVATEKYNVEAEQEFNAKMNALRSSQAQNGINPAAQVQQGDLAFWEKEIEGSGLWRVEDMGYAGLENTSTVTLERTALMNGGMLLVNPWHPLPLDFMDTDLVGVGTASGYKIQVKDNTVKVFPNAFDALNAIIEAAAEENHVDYIVREAYRTMENQTALFNQKMDDLSKDYSGDILTEQAKKEVNYPGTSEYQSGLSFRMDLYNKSDASVNDQKFQQSEPGKWFTNNCWKYGIIFRFPTENFPSAQWEDKSYKTGVSMQMNLYRYVGKAHAVAMRVMDYCLEEYVEFLADHPHICIYMDGALQYEVFRIPTTEELPTYDLPVPNPASDFQASLDNMGGVVMAYVYAQ